MSTTHATSENAFVVSPEHRAALDEQGFFTTPVLFDDATLAAVREAFEQLWQDDIEVASKRDALSHKLARHRPFMPQLDHRHPACDAFCRHPAMMALCRQLVGPDVDMTWNQAILKPPANSEMPDNNFGWHQDNWYAITGVYSRDSNMRMLLRNDTGITVWAAISRTTVENGTLWVLPGRHREGLLKHLWSEERREWQGQYDDSDKVPAVMEPGQVLVFRRYLPHSSSVNVSNETRMAYQIGYGRPGLKTRPSRDLSPVLRDGEPTPPRHNT